MGHEQHGGRGVSGAWSEGDPLSPEGLSPEGLSSDERRESGRYDVTWPVDCRAEDTFLYAAITNISAMGIFVRTNKPLEIGRELILRFAPTPLVERDRLSQEPFEEFVLRGAVQWINRDANGSPNPGMGIRFIELSADDRERIVEVIHTIAYLREEPVARD
jgi:type IV pilus assembly protein PilZ